MIEEDEKVSIPVFVPLDRLSVAELQERIVALQGEIVRIKAELDKREKHKATISSLFKQAPDS